MSPRGHASGAPGLSIGRTRGPGRRERGDHGLARRPSPDWLPRVRSRATREASNPQLGATAGLHLGTTGRSAPHFGPMARRLDGEWVLVGTTSDGAEITMPTSIRVSMTVNDGLATEVEARRFTGTLVLQPGSSRVNFDPGEQDQRHESASSTTTRRQETESVRGVDRLRLPDRLRGPAILAHCGPSRGSRKGPVNLEPSLTSSRCPNHLARGGSAHARIFGDRYGSCDGVGRRNFLRVGALGLGGLDLAGPPPVAVGRGPSGQSPQDTAVIQVFLGGGPSHMETYDPKPEPRRSIRASSRRSRRASRASGSAS